MGRNEGKLVSWAALDVTGGLEKIPEAVGAGASGLDTDGFVFLEGWLDELGRVVGASDDFGDELSPFVLQEMLFSFLGSLLEREGGGGCSGRARDG